MENFSAYDLIIDARSPKEYQEDHIPGAVNMPVVNNAEYAEVGTLYKTNRMAAYRLGAGYSLKNIARHLAEDLPQYNEQSRILVYCFRGGKRSQLWTDILEAIGYKVCKLQGGWKSYRRWVNEQLALVPTQYRYNILSGATACGKTRLLSALRLLGAQVLDLEDIAGHRGSVLGSVPGVCQPSQKYFDTQLLSQISHFDPTRPIWVEAESKKIGNVQLPAALLATMRTVETGFIIQIEADIAQRVLLCREDYRHFETNPDEMLERLKFLRALVGGAEFAIWEQLVTERQMPALFERLMRHHYDPAYRRSVLRNYPSIDTSESVKLTDLSEEGLHLIAQSMLLRYEKPN